MSDISLTAAVRQNLLSLQNTAKMMSTTQNRLSTGNKVNSALDNPSNYFTASSLNSRASDLSSLMDSMSSGIQTLEAADNGLSSITTTLESMQSTLRQARQDKSFETASYTMPTGTATGSEKLTLSGGAFTTDTDIALTKEVTDTAATAGTATVAFSSGGTVDSGDSFALSVTVDGSAQAITIDNAAVTAVGNGDSSIDSAAELAAILTNKVSGVTVATDGNNITLTSATTGTSSDVDISAATLTDGDSSSTATAANLGLGSLINGTAGSAAATHDEFKSVDELVNEINNSATLNTKVKASNDDGKLRLQNLSTQALDVDGVTSSGVVDGTSSGAATILGNSVRSELADQFNELRDQLDKTADDASFNGINLLRGDNLKITFNETGTSSIDIQAKDGKSIDSTSLGVPTTLQAANFDADSEIDGYLDDIKSALNSVRSQSSTFGSNLSVVQNRQDFTTDMVNTLQTGAGNLTLADMNEEAANMVALQTRQSLATSSLSMANQADQNVLQLLR